VPLADTGVGEDASGAKRVRFEERLGLGDVFSVVNDACA
jgi:hypothetical protein